MKVWFIPINPLDTVSSQAWANSFMKDKKVHSVSVVPGVPHYAASGSPPHLSHPFMMIVYDDKPKPKQNRKE